MKTLQLHDASTLVLDKITSLISLLRDVRSKYETAALSVSEKNIREAFQRLGDECSAYATELSSQLQASGMQSEDLMEDNTREAELSDSCLQQFLEGQDLWSYCAQNEIRILKAYRQVLNDSHLSENFRKKIRFQFNSLLFVFLQMKLLK